MTYRILSIDGGGIYTATAMKQLQQLEAAHPGMLDKVDLLAGTSSGGLIALCLANRNSPTSIVESVVRNSTKIFSNSLGRRLLSAIGLIARYPSSGLIEVLCSTFGHMIMSDLPVKVMVPSYRISPAERQGIVILHNFRLIDQRNRLSFNVATNNSAAMKVVDVAAATASPPVYFPSWGNFVDGAVAENNPGMAAIAQTQDISLDVPNRPSLNDIVLLSLGRTSAGVVIPGDNIDWGWARWITPLFQILLSSDGSTSDYQLKQFLGCRYHRANVELPANLNNQLDDISAIGPVLDDTDVDDELLLWVKEYWMDAKC